MILKRIIKVSVVFVLILMTSSAFGQQPDDVTYDTLSIVNGRNFITWQKNKDNYTDSYFINKQVWNGFFFIWEDPPLGQTSDTVFTDNISNPCDSSLTYAVIAVFHDTIAPDSIVIRTSPLNLTTKIVKNIYLFPPVLNKCTNAVNLLWTAYINMPPRFGKYYILADTTDNGIDNFFKIDSTLTEADTFYIHQNLVPDTKYTYMIRAVNDVGTKSTSSCKKSILSYALLQPDSVYVRYATVKNNEYVELGWTIRNDAKISKFKILRSIDGVNFENIGENNHSGDFIPDTVFIDYDADFDAQSYYYQIRVCDSCGVDRLASENIARTIHLSGIPGITGSANDLSWNHYEGWDFGNSGIDFYKIFRKVNGTDNGIDDPLFPSETSYLDEVSAFSTSEGVFNYYIVAYEKDGDNGFETFKDFSISNEIEIKQETRAILPNAFTPGRPPNEIFKPILAFIDVDGYSLAIFNKWGQLIFITEDPSGDGWDGKFKGEFVPTDSYVYQLKYRTPQGQNLEKMGTVTVIR